MGERRHQAPEAGRSQPDEPDALPTTSAGGERAALARVLARRSHAALDFLVERAPVAVLTQALEAPTAAGGIARLVSALAGADTPVRAADPAAAAIARAARQEADLLERFPAVSTAGAAALLGITPNAVTKRRTVGTLLALPVAGDYRYPRFQFRVGLADDARAEHGVLPGLAEALRAMRASDVDSPWVQLQVLTGPMAALGGRSVVEVLEAGDAEERAAAVRAAGRYGHHGA